MGWVANALKSWKVGRGQKSLKTPVLGGLRLKKNSESLLYIIFRNSPVNWELRLIGTKCLEPMCPN